MKCFECGGEMVKKHDGLVFYKKDKSPVYFENVPLNECVQCGEKYIDGQVTEKIGNILNADKIESERHLVIPIISMAA